jgi:hypothetical protein
MMFRNGKAYTVSQISRHDPDWQTVAQKVAERTKPSTPQIRVDEVYSLKWTAKPFPWSYYHEFRPKRRFFFHGTSRATVERILDEGFRIFPKAGGLGNLLGDGIYVSYHTNKSRAFTPDGYMLSVMVYAPNTLCLHPGQSLDDNTLAQSRATHDAIEVRTGAIVRGWTMQNHEICVLNAVRTIPRFIIKVS